MKTELYVFSSQFAMIFLLGIQQMNVTGRHFVAAFITSLLLGICGYYLTSVIAQINIEGVLSSVWWSFIMSGPLGIITAMKVHPIIRKRWLHE